MNQAELTRNFWKKEIRRGNLCYPHEQVIRFVKHNFKDPEKTRILDFGCGAGRNTLALLCEGYRVVAMDYVESAVELTGEKCKAFSEERFNVILNKEFEFELENESLDAVVCCGSLAMQSQGDVLRLLTEIKRVMKKDALVWADFRTVDDSLYGMGECVDDNYFIMNKISGFEGSTFTFYTEEMLRRLFSKAGFEVLEIEKNEITRDNQAMKMSHFEVVGRK